MELILWNQAAIILKISPLFNLSLLRTVSLFTGKQLNNIMLISLQINREISYNNIVKTLTTHCTTIPVVLVGAQTGWGMKLRLHVVLGKAFVPASKLIHQQYVSTNHLLLIYILVA